VIEAVEREMHLNARLLAIETGLASEKELSRCNAMQSLLALVKQDKGIGVEALPMIRGALERARDPWVTAMALAGLEVIAGKQEARIARDLLLFGGKGNIAKAVVLSMRDAGEYAVLIDLLSRSTDEEVCISAIRMLGRFRNPAALPVLAGLMSKANFCPHVVEALGELGDARAIPFLVRHLEDETDAWPVDNHGPMLRVSDLAEEAIRRLGGR
jgi:HEAT repeat protein